MILNKNAYKIFKGNLCRSMKIMSRRRHHYPSMTTMVAKHLGLTFLLILQFDKGVNVNKPSFHVIFSPGPKCSNNHKPNKKIGW